MPFSKIQLRLVEDLGVRELLVQDRPHAVGAALGRERQALDAGVGELEHELRREVVEPQRGHRDLVVECRQVVHDPVDLGVVADRGRDEADLARDAAHLARARHDLGAREAAHGQVVVAGPAEAAHARAAARDLDHVLHRHLGVRRQDHRLREAPSRPASRAGARACPGRRRRRRCRRRGSAPRSGTGRRSRPSAGATRGPPAGRSRRAAPPSFAAPSARPRRRRSGPRTGRAAPGSGTSRPRPSTTSGSRGPRSLARSGIPARRSTCSTCR